MAFRAGDAGMSPRRDREGVVEDRARPARRRGAVAVGAIGREPGRPVVGIRRPVVVGQVAGNAFRRCALVDAVLVAVGARDLSVTTAEREEGVGERSSLPRSLAVALGAVRREAGLGVVRILRPVIVGRVASVAGRRLGPEAARAVTG